MVIFRCLAICADDQYVVDVVGFCSVGFRVDLQRCQWPGVVEWMKRHAILHSTALLVNGHRHRLVGSQLSAPASET